MPDLLTQFIDSYAKLAVSGRVGVRLGAHCSARHATYCLLTVAESAVPLLSHLRGRSQEHRPDT